MKKLYLLSLFYLCFTPLSAQKNNIPEEAESINIAELRDHMFYLASDDVDKTVYDFFQRSCKLVYEVIMELANGNVSPGE